MRQKGENLAASVKQKLLNLSRERGEDPNLVFIRYAVERFLYRVSCSQHSARFILKGAMLFAVWMDKPYRPTKDVDLLGFGDASAQELQSVIQDICHTEVQPDGIEFKTDAIGITEIREDLEYPGKRIKIESRMGNVRINIQVDIGFGDSVIPRPARISYPTLLEMPAPFIFAYPPETVVAEKFESMVSRGILNSRMKDYYDVKVISEKFVFQGQVLCDAIKATFQRRGTVIPVDIPIALTEEFSSNPDKKAQWKGFLKTSKLDDKNADIAQVINDISAFLMPPVLAAASNKSFAKRWSPGGPWK